MKASEGFSGAEIEQGVVSAMFAANADGSSLAIDQLLTEFERTRPLSVVMREKIDALRRWAAERSVSAHHGKYRLAISRPM